MSKKIKSAFLTFALTAMVAVSASMSACTIKTNHPCAKITVSFNEVEYEIEYQLYRNMYPQTVQHFIELADEGFYDNMIVHNYNTSGDWFTGAYSYYDGTDEVSYGDAYTGSVMGEYLDNTSKEAAYYDLFNQNKFTRTVYKSISYKDNGDETVSDADALPTLIGEFSANDHIIENGALTATLGCLKMFYYDKGDSNLKATIKTSNNEILEHDYRYNCATSIFSMQMGSSSSYTATSYCIFGQLKNDNAKSALTDLTKAVSDYISNELGGQTTKFTTSVTTEVDKLDTFGGDGGIEYTFTMTSLPIIVKTVQITKY